MNIEDFLKTGKYHNSGTIFQGCFNMNLNHARILLDYFTTNNENLIDDYCEVIYLSWESLDTEFYYRRNVISDLHGSISKIRGLGIFDVYFIWYCKGVVRKYFDNLKKENERIYQIPRKKAQKFISNPEVREQIFNKYGAACLRCGSTEKLSIDHVVPVAKGGENHVKNLQPLCKSCNSRKSDQIIDYRNG